MSISDRYRDIYRQVQVFGNTLHAYQEQAPQASKAVSKAVDGLEQLREQVGDIPRMHLEAKLTPVLLKAHNHLDRGRLLLDEGGLEDLAADAWDLQQSIYRLLNDL